MVQVMRNIRSGLAAAFATMSLAGGVAAQQAQSKVPPEACDPLACIPMAQPPGMPPIAAEPPMEGTPVAATTLSASASASTTAAPSASVQAQAAAPAPQVPFEPLPMKDLKGVNAIGMNVHTNKAGNGSEAVRTTPGAEMRFGGEIAGDTTMRAILQVGADVNIFTGPETGFGLYEAFAAVQRDLPRGRATFELGKFGPLRGTLWQEETLRQPGGTPTMATFAISDQITAKDMFGAGGGYAWRLPRGNISLDGKMGWSLGALGDDIGNGLSTATPALGNADEPSAIARVTYDTRLPRGDLLTGRAEFSILQKGPGGDFAEMSAGTAALWSRAIAPGARFAAGGEATQLFNANAEQGVKRTVAVATAQLNGQIPMSDDGDMWAGGYVAGSIGQGRQGGGLASAEGGFNFNLGGANLNVALGVERDLRKREFGAGYLSNVGLNIAF